MAASNAWLWLVLLCGSGCTNAEHAQDLRVSLQEGPVPLADRVTGPVVTYFADSGALSVLCEDAAKRQAPAWEQAIRKFAPVCRSDEQSPPFVFCISIEDTQAIGLAFDEGTSRLLGVALGRVDKAASFAVMIAALRAGPATCAK
jgi:hypothetical protein